MTKSGRRRGAPTRHTRAVSPLSEVQAGDVGNPGRSTPALNVMRLRDGRNLAWVEVGDPGGSPVLALHGSPGRCYEFAMHDEAASAAGIRLIAPDRPGYGASSYQPHRRLSDFPATVAQLADHVGLGTFAVLGHSQGGPHALACARFLPDRIRACAAVNGLAPPGPSAMTDGMMRSNRIQWALYSRWPPALDGAAVALGWLMWPIIAVALWSGRRKPEAGLERFSRMLPACDVEVMGRPEVRN